MATPIIMITLCYHPYSLGVIAYMLLLGRHLFPAATVRSFLRRVRTEPPDLIALAEIFNQLLARVPTERPATAHAVIDALRQAVGLPILS